MIGYKERWLLKVALKILVRLFWLPVWFMRHLYRGTGRLSGAWVLARTDALPCPACEAAISLVGRWECGMCSYVFDGFAFARCEVCGAVPPFIECQVCGLSVRNPLIF